MAVELRTAEKIESKIEEEESIKTNKADTEDEKLHKLCNNEPDLQASVQLEEHKECHENDFQNVSVDNTENNNSDTEVKSQYNRNGVNENQEILTNNDIKKVDKTNNHESSTEIKINDNSESTVKTDNTEANSNELENNTFNCEVIPENSESDKKIKEKSNDIAISNEIEINTRNNSESNSCCIVELGSELRFSHSVNINANKDQFVVETLRNLTSRKPINDRVSKFVSKNDRAANFYFGKTAGGTKRKEHSETPENTKRLKRDTSYFFTCLSNPMINFKNHWYGLTSDTPKLTENKNISTQYKDEDTKINNKERWCLLM